MDISEVDWNPDYDGETFEIEALGKIIVGCHWRCKNCETKNVIIYMHGMCSAVCFNANVLRVFAEHGCAAIATDHWGHGRSGNMNTATTIPMLLEELKTLIEYSRVLYKDIPIYIMGHSLGGLATLTFCLQHSTYINMVKGIIVTAPLLRNNAFQNPSKMLRLALNIGSKFFENILIPTGLGSARSVYPDAYKELVANSPYSQSAASCVVLYSSLTTMDKVQKQAKEFPKELPLLFLQGSGDTTVHVGTNREWAKEIPHAEYHEFKDAPHDIMKSSYRKEIFEIIFKFIGIDI